MKIIEEHGTIVITSGFNEEGREALTVYQTGDFAKSYIRELGALEMAKDILHGEYHRQINEE
ncbi:hypothetical protein [uncultured Mobiluncus sp.]|uniref:hypothetical protein n=1 Tax=uncultured Mobiluncus sp. TaxID=293425 RepID=UPI00261C5978|nr:hypothetical protein [uncultured Mobiluncus sp.]